MTEELFFNKLVTKSMQAIQGDERFFEGYLTVEIKDKQGEITVVDELYKVLPIWMDRGAPISDTHSNRIIGKGINYAKTTYKTKDGEEFPAIKITGKIHKDYELDNEIWKKIKSGEYKGLSFGGATKSDRDPVRMKDGSIAYSLKDLEHYEVAVCADPAVPLALITDYNPVAKSATNAVVREDGKMIIKCDKFGCMVTKAFVEQPDKDPEPTDDIKNNGSSHFHKFIAMYPESDTTRQFNDPDKKRRSGVSEPFFGAGHFSSALWEGRMTDARERADDKNIKMLDGMLNRKIDPNKKRGDLDQKTQRLDKTDNITKPIPDGKGGKGDFDHCEEKNQDKNDPAAFCGAIQHKLEKAIEAGMLQQVVKNGLEIFMTKDELKKVCSACGKTLEEHGVIKYDHSNTMGDQHSMYNQNTGSETWVGQGLPQPTVEGNDDNPAEEGLTINGDARQNSGKKKKGRTARNRKRRQTKQVREGMDSLESIVGKSDEEKVGTSTSDFLNNKPEKRERQLKREQRRNQNIFGDFSGDPDKMVATPEQIERKRIKDAKETKELAQKKERRMGGIRARRAKLGKSLVSIFKEDEPVEYTEDEKKEMDIKEIQNQAAKVIAEDKKRLENPMVQNMYKSLESMFKKKEEKNEGNVNSEQGTKEPDTECKWCKKDPNSDKKQWQRDSADNWTKFFGGNQTIGEWFALNTHGLDSETAGKHDKNPDLYHKIHANLPKEKKEMRETPQAVGDTGLPPTPEFETNYTNAMNAAADKLRGKPRKRKSLESMFKTDQADKEEESKQMKEIAHDAESIQEKEVSDVPLPRVAREGSRPCKDCGKIHERSSLLADERAEDALQDKTNPYRLDDAVDLLGAMNIDLDTVEGKTGHKKHGSDVSLKSLESIFKREGANQAWGFKKDKLEPVLGNVQSNKAEEGMIGAGQRGLGYSNEGYTSVQGSGQSHTISEIPPEMEVIVHDVDEIKESKKEGYTTEAGNSKAGDPSRATDDDDSLLSEIYINHSYKD